MNFICPVSVVASQSTEPEFTGTVTDSKGAIIPKAQVVVHNQLTNTDVKAVTTSSCDYYTVTIYDPLTLHKNANGKLVRDPFPGNKIPASRLNSIAQKLVSYFPTPNVTVPSGQNPFANNFHNLNAESSSFATISS